jgi:hypothetical protein
MAAVLGTVAVTGMVGCGKGSDASGQGAATVTVHQQALTDITKVTVSVSGAAESVSLPPIPLVGNSSLPSTQYSAVISDLPIGCDYVFTASAVDSTNTVIYTGTSTGQCITKNQTANIIIDMADQKAHQTINDEAPFIDSITDTAGCVSVGDKVTIKATMHDIDTGDTAGMTWAWSVAACGTLTGQVDTAGTDSVPATSTVTFTAVTNNASCQVNLVVNDKRMPTTLQTKAAVAIMIGDSCAYGNAKITAIPDTCPAVTGVASTMSPLVAGQTTTVSVVASDSDGDALNYHWTSDCTAINYGYFVTGGTTSTTATGNPVQFTYTGSNGADCNFYVTVDDGTWASGQLAGQTKCSVVANLSAPGTSTGYTQSDSCKWSYDYQSSNSVGDGDVVTLEIVAPCANPVWSAGTAIPTASLIAPFTTGVTFTTPTGSITNGADVTVTCGTGAAACSHDFPMIGKAAYCAQPGVVDGADCTSSAQIANKCVQSATCSAGHCVAQTTVTCSPSTTACKANTCNTATGVCGLVAGPDGNTCSDGLACTTGDTCNGGTCQPTGTVTCAPTGSVCSVNACQEPSGTCAVTNAPTGTTCNDSNACTTPDTCTAGVCGGPAVTCAVGYACDTVQGCIPFICDRPSWDKDVVPYFYGLNATGDGSAWGAGTFFGPYDFGTGTTLTALSSDGFLVKYDSTGAALQAWNFGDTPNNHDQSVSGLAVDKSGNVLMIGSFGSEIDFDSAGAGGLSGSGVNGVDYLVSGNVINYYAVISGASSGVDPTPVFAHMAKLGTGTLLAAGSNPTQDAFAICGKTSAGVTAFAAGNANSVGILSTATTATGGGMDLVVAKIDGTTTSATKGQVLWGKQFGGTGDQICTSVTVDYNGDVIITGTNAGTLVLGSTTLTAPTGASVLFVAKLNGTTGAPISAAQFGAAGTVVPKVAVDSNSNIAIAGGMKNVGTGIVFSTSPAVSVSYAGGYDLFAVKLDTNLVPKCAFSDGDAANDQIVNSVDFDSAGNIVMAGGFIGGLPGLGLTNSSITAQDIVELTLKASDCTPSCIKQYGSAAGSQQGNLVSVANSSLVPSALQNSIWLAGSYSDTITWDTSPASTLNSGGTGITHNFLARQK